MGVTSDEAARDGGGAPTARDAMRARGRAARRAVDPAGRAAAEATVAARILALPEVAAAERVLLTRAVGDELDLRPLEDGLRRRGVAVALPVVDGPGLLVVDLDEDGTTTPGWRRVPEPVGDPTDGHVDVVVVPALVLDRHGGRLGYGGGHFDRFLAGPGRDALAVGAVFAAQLVDRVPTEPHDVAMDVVVTETSGWRDGAPLA